MLSLEQDAKLLTLFRQRKALTPCLRHSRLALAGSALWKQRGMLKAEPTTDKVIQWVFHLIDMAILQASSVEIAQAMTNLRNQLFLYLSSGYRKEV